MFPFYFIFYVKAWTWLSWSKLSAKLKKKQKNGIEILAQLFLSLIWIKHAKYFWSITQELLGLLKSKFEWHFLFSPRDFFQTICFRMRVSFFFLNVDNFFEIVHKSWDEYITKFVSAQNVFHFSFECKYNTSDRWLCWILLLC